jgi:hypothetical protein
MTDPSPLDTLMSRIEEINHKQPPLTANDITTTIAFHRHMRARKAAGDKTPTKAMKADSARVIANLEALLGVSAPKKLVPGPFRLKKPGE